MAHDIFDELTKAWQPRLRMAFLKAVAAITDQVTIKAIVAELENGDIEGALKAVGVEDYYFDGLAEQIRQVFTAGGKGTARLVPTIRTASGNVIRFVFAARAREAEDWIRSRSSEMVQGIVTGQTDMIRVFLRDGLVAGQNPRATALDLVGRISKASGNRVGGVIGLTEAQEQWQRAYAAELASNDPTDLRKALRRDLRDKRYDRTIAKAIREGRAIPAEMRQKMLLAYRNRSLKYRADAIARTETARSLGEAHRQAWEQAFERRQVDRTKVVKVPKYIHDGHARLWHREVAEMNKDGVPWDLPYAVPDGMVPQMHAPYDEPMCRCRETVKIIR